MKTKLKELAVKAQTLRGETKQKTEGQKEFGFFTKNRPEYDEGGNFTGMRNSVDASKTVTGAVGTAALAGGGLIAHNTIQSGFGNQGLESYKQAGRFAANQAGSAVKGAYATNPAIRTGRAFVKNKGRNLIGAIGRIASNLKGLSAPLRLRELSKKCEELAPKKAA